MGERGADNRDTVAATSGPANVWVARPCSPAEVEHLLSDAERARLARFRFDADASSYASAHALVRLALSAADPRTSPRDWCFRTAEFGKPEIHVASTGKGESVAELRFNLSHSRGFVAVATLVGDEIGVDVEAVRTIEVVNELRERVLSPLEAEALDALPVGDRPARFFSIWSLKESYIKARGLGLRLPLKEISFSFDGLDGLDGARLTQTPIAGPDEPADWTVKLAQLDTQLSPQLGPQLGPPPHALAVTAACQGSLPVKIRVRQVDLGPLAQSDR